MPVEKLLQMLLAALHKVGAVIRIELASEPLISFIEIGWIGYVQQCIACDRLGFEKRGYQKTENS